MAAKPADSFSRCLAEAGRKMLLCSPQPGLDPIEWTGETWRREFQNINHQKLLNKLKTYPAMKRTIQVWLKAWVIDKGACEETRSGTPQGGTVSPLLMNVALYGMETAVIEAFRTKEGKPQFICYADELVVFHATEEGVKRARAVLEAWLVDIGLELKPSKTKITHTFTPYGLDPGKSGPPQKGKGSCRRNNGPRPGEFKGEAVQLAKTSNKPMTQIARDLGSADSTLHHWCKLFSEQGEQAFPGSGHQTSQEEEIRHLEREKELLRQERDILKKAISIFSRGQL